MYMSSVVYDYEIVKIGLHSHSFQFKRKIILTKAFQIDMMPQK